AAPLIGQAARIPNWTLISTDDTVSPASGQRLAVYMWSSQSGADVGQLGRGGSSVTSPRGITFTEADELPAAWTADSKAVIFFSDRNGHWCVFKQALDQDSAEVLVT